MSPVTAQRRTPSGKAAALRRFAPAGARGSKINPAYSPLIQRKPACACGGTCPKCRTEDAVQTKLRIGAANDKYEQEADRVADQVIHTRGTSFGARVPQDEEEVIQTKSMASSVIQRAVLEEEEEPAGTAAPVEGEEEVALQLKGMPGRGPGIGKAAGERVRSLHGGGRPLPVSTRYFFETRLDHDFSGVRIHTGANAAEAAQSLHARAFTVGNDVVFNHGEYSPHSDSGKHLLAHELIHTVQQSAIGESLQKQDGAAAHAQEAVTPQEYIAEHTSFFNLDEDGLGSDLFFLAALSPDHYEFVLEVFKELDYADGIQVGEAFFNSTGEVALQNIAETEAGRKLLRSISIQYLPLNDPRQQQITALIDNMARLQREREAQRRKENAMTRDDLDELTCKLSVFGWATKVGDIFALKATIAAEPVQYSSAWITDKRTGEGAGYGLGHSLDERWKILEIHPRQVIVENDCGQRETLLMDDSSSAEETADEIEVKGNEGPPPGEISDEARDDPESVYGHSKYTQDKDGALTVVYADGTVEYTPDDKSLPTVTFRIFNGVYYKYAENGARESTELDPDILEEYLKLPGNTLPRE